MRLFGYGRVSTSQQSLDIQIAAIEAKGVESHDIYTDKESGKNLNRKGLNELRKVVESGDKILVTRLDRLGRDTLDMMELVKEFADKNVHVEFFEDGYDTSRSQDGMVITIMSAIAKSERRRILERTEDGRVAAKAKGIKFGAKRKIDRVKFTELVSANTGASAIAKEMGISRSAVYKLKAEKYTYWLTLVDKEGIEVYRKPREESDSFKADLALLSRYKESIGCITKERHGGKDYAFKVTDVNGRCLENGTFLIDVRGQCVDA